MKAVINEVKKQIGQCPKSILKMDLLEQIKILKEKLSNIYSKDSGRTRDCFFVSDEFVVKIPLDEAGCFDNEREARICKIYNKQINKNCHYDGDPHYAKCQLEYIWSVPILFMERVRLPVSYKGLPDWIGYIDCMQVGYNKQGKLVAYDYA